MARRELELSGLASARECRHVSVLGGNENDGNTDTEEHDVHNSLHIT